MIYYDGLLTEEERDKYIKEFKTIKHVFERLYDSTRIIPCSSLFHYNLDLLSRIIVEKLGTSSSGRFRWFIEEKPMNKISFAKARKYSNMILFDMVKEKVYDLDKLGGEDGD